MAAAAADLRRFWAGCNAYGRQTAAMRALAKQAEVIAKTAGLLVTGKGHFVA